VCASSSLTGVNSEQNWPGWMGPPQLDCDTVLAKSSMIFTVTVTLAVELL
jgi:hypothetical protein